MIKQYGIGNAQTQGKCGIQSNYFSIADNSAGELFAVLADGTVDHKNGRRAAIIAVEYCVREFARNSPATVKADEFMRDTAFQANKQIEDLIYADKIPRVSLTMAWLTGSELKYFNVGANRLYLYNGRNELNIGSDLNNLYAAGRYELPPKTTVGIFSAGVYTDIQPIERINIIADEKKFFRKNIFDKAQNLVEYIQKKGLKNQKNITALLIEVEK